MQLYICVLFQILLTSSCFISLEKVHFSALPIYKEVFIPSHVESDSCVVPGNVAPHGLNYQQEIGESQKEKFSLCLLSYGLWLVKFSSCNAFGEVESTKKTDLLSNLFCLIMPLCEVVCQHSSALHYIPIVSLLNFPFPSPSWPWDFTSHTKKY